MLVSLKWLKEYVEINESVKELGDILTMSGTKVETILPVSDIVQGIYTGEIKKIEKHPNADKLQVCTMDMGELGEKCIITSAKNVFEGAVVPVALEGAIIGDGTKMGMTEFRGVESQGMMCSVAEMGMNTSLFAKEILDGIFIMPEGVRKGEDIRSLMWVDDYILDLELTANRADCQSVYGIALETAAALDKKIQPIDLYDKAESESEIQEYLNVTIENEVCLRYTAKMLRIKEIKQSPLWLQLKLLNSGVRPINNIVDVTNYVMLELGQPLHAFDYKDLNSSEIIVKTTEDTVFKTLDDIERNIDSSMLMITNGKVPVAIAGVMGGANSEINNNTELVVLESACFDKTSVRLTSKKLGLRTESSSRYEKGLYPNLTEKAIRRAIYLLEKIGACEVIPGMIDLYPAPTRQETIKVNYKYINQSIGIQLSIEKIKEILERLFLSVQILEKDILLVNVPDYRQDLTIPADIVEEVARIYGYDKIPSTIMGGTTLVGGKTDSQKYQESIEKSLIGSGYYQTLTTSFTNIKKYEELGLSTEDLVVIKNPLGEDSGLMRNNLMGHQIDIISMNFNRNNKEGKFFEIAKTYHKNEVENQLPIEIKKLVLSAYGNVDYFDLKGMVEQLFDDSEIKNYNFVVGNCELFHPGRCATIMVEDEVVGVIGEIHPRLTKKLQLPKRAYVCELNIDIMTQRKQTSIKYQELPKYPGSTRDIAVLLDLAIPSAQIKQCIESFDNGIIHQITLFDVYQGDQIPQGKKSLAYSIYFLSKEKTLTEEEINPIMENIIQELKHKFNADLRE